MPLKDVNQDLPILEFFYEQVIQNLEGRSRRNKISRRAILDSFLRTRSFSKTAKEFGVTPSAINEVVYMAFRTARKFAGLQYIKPDEEIITPQATV